MRRRWWRLGLDMRRRSRLSLDVRLRRRLRLNGVGGLLVLDGLRLLDMAGLDGSLMNNRCRLSLWLRRRRRFVFL
jgi:hypothetical protein